MVSEMVKVLDSCKILIKFLKVMDADPVADSHGDSGFNPFNTTSPMEFLDWEGRILEK